MRPATSSLPSVLTPDRRHRRRLALGLLLALLAPLGLGPAAAQAGPLMTGAGQGGGPHVQVFEGVPRVLAHSFLAFPPAFLGGVHVALGDVNGDGVPDLIVGAGPGGGPN